MRDSDGFLLLEESCSKLYKKVRYQTELTLVINKITEYDIRSANTTMLRWGDKVSDSLLTEIESLPKGEREVFIGKMIRKEPSIQTVISKGIIRAKKKLFMSNQIQDEEVLSIKNDAVFIIGRKLKDIEFGPVLFKEKHTFSVYMNLDGIEFYYDRKNDYIKISGVSDDIIYHQDHQKGIILFFKDVMRFLALDHKDKLRKYLISFVDRYKRKELPVYYYRELNGYNIYRTKYEVAGYEYNLEQAGDGDKEMINGIYNYSRFVLPVINRFI